MEPVHPVEAIDCGGCGRAVVWGVVAALRYPAVGIPLGTLALCVLVFVVWRVRRAARRVMGTAQVLSVDTMVDGEGSVPGELYRVTLRVEVPGRPTYEAAAAEVPLNPDEVADMQPGKTVAVTVRSADPQDVLIDFTKPIT